MNPDLFFYSGPITQQGALDFLQEVNQTKTNSQECLLTLATFGGNPHAAYKIGRYLQNAYKTLRILVGGYCKSAGTLVATAANEIILAPFGELGPLDVQTIKEDSARGVSSGLDISAALDVVSADALSVCVQTVERLRGLEGKPVSTATALRAGADLVNALYAPITSNIDVEELGARAREMRVATYYAHRLDGKSQNLLPHAVQWLVENYPSHGFAIDFDEAKLLFKNVQKATSEQIEILDAEGIQARIPDEQPIIRTITLSRNEREDTDDNADKSKEQSNAGSDEASS